MFYLWCNTHKGEDTVVFFFVCLFFEDQTGGETRDKKVPAAEVAANHAMNQKVGWSELNCINTNSCCW